MKSSAKVEMTISMEIDSISMVGIIRRRGVLVRQNQIGNLNDVKLLFKADGLLYVAVGEQQVSKVIVRERFGMLGNPQARFPSHRPAAHQ